jgi:hypothetical protein
MQQGIAAPGRTQSLGKPGDLADTIVSIFSLAALEHGFRKVSAPDFYKLFLRLTEEMPEKLPAITFERTGRYVYSKVVGDALERALRSGVEVMNPRFLCYGIQEEANAQSNLELIRENTGGDFIENLRPVAARLAELAREAEVTP